MNHHFFPDAFIFIGWLLLSITAALLPTAVHGQDTTPPMTPIYTIQGDGAATALRGQRVNSAGIVTAVGPRGFFMQDATGDGRAETSDGIYVYTNRAPTVFAGQCVLVRDGLVEEYYDKTELSKAAAVEPAALCAPVAPAAVPLPVVQFGQDAQPILEALEGMLVDVRDLAGVVQGPTKRFENGDVELALIPQRLMPYIADGRVQQADVSETAVLHFLSGALGTTMPDAHWGDRVRVGVTQSAPESGQQATAQPSAQAVIDYNFGKYQIVLLPGTAVAHESVQLEKDDLLPTQLDEYTVCAFNLHGMGSGAAQYPSPGEYTVQLRKRAALIADRLQGCTIIALQELGAPEDAKALAQLLADEFDLPYTATALPGPQSAARDFPLTNALLTRTDRVTVVAATSPQGCSPISYAVFDVPGACPIGAYGLFDRLPLVVDVQVAGAWGDPLDLRLINNHWKSKGGDEAVNAPRRRAQAVFVAGLAQEPLARNPDAEVIVLGDLNDYLGSEPVEVLRTLPEPDLEQAHDWLPRLDRYSYIFNGASQVLDHLLFSPGLLDSLVEVNAVRVSADYAVPVQDLPDNYLHASDHDPLLVRFRPGSAAWLGGNLRYPGIAISAQSAGSDLIMTATTDANGDYRLWNLRATTTLSLTLTAPPHIALPMTPDPFALRPGANTYSAQPVHRAVQSGAAAILSTTRPVGRP